MKKKKPRSTARPHTTITSAAPPTPSPGVYKIVWTIVGLVFAALVVWVARGVVEEGGLLWWLMALVLAPVVLYGLFIAAIGASFVRQGRRNVREAQRRQRDGR